jgi:hypothetical protein
MFKFNGLGIRSSCLALAKNLVLLTCVAALVACAGTSAERRDEVIPERAQARWDALLDGEYEKAYAYASPGYRSTASANDFEISFRARRFQYTSAEYMSHSCEEALCLVKMNVGYRVVRPAPGLPEWNGSSVVEERWILTDGRWWFLPQ